MLKKIIFILQPQEYAENILKKLLSITFLLPN